MAATSKNTLWSTILSSRFYIGPEIPTSGAELSKRLTEAVRNVAGAAVRADGVRATIEQPPNIAELRADFAGMDLAVDPDVASRAKNEISSDLTDVVDRIPATIARVIVKAHPLVVQGVPVDFDLEASDVPFNWVKDKQGKIWFGFSEQKNDSMRGEFSGHITKGALRQAVKEAVAAAASQRGFHLIDLDFDITQNGRNFLLVGDAKLRKGILSAKAEARASLNYDPQSLTVTITQLEIHSGNPAVSMLLHMMQSTIDKYRGQTMDLNELLSPTGQKLQALDISVTHADIQVQGKF